MLVKEEIERKTERPKREGLDDNKEMV